MIRRGVISLGFLFLCLLFVKNIHAHEENQPPFLKINDHYTEHYKVRSFSVKDFILPQDNISTVFLIDDPIIFTIESAEISLSEEMKYPGNISWDFGDGVKTTGFTVAHSYKSIGSHLLTVKAKFNERDDNPVNNKERNN